MPVGFEFEHDIDAVYEVLTDPQFLVDRNLALGELSAEADAEGDGDSTVLNVVREVQRDLPGFLSRLFDTVQVMDMKEVWHPHGDGWRGEWNMDVRGQPVSIAASFELVPTRDGCRYSVAHRVRAKIPMVGGKVEKYILGQTTQGATDELQYLKDYLG